MTLYEIDVALMTAIAHGTDPETGEINNLDELMGLQMERDQKIENIACLIKNLKDDVRGLKAEAQVLTERAGWRRTRWHGWKPCLMRPWTGRNLPRHAVWCPLGTPRR